ncbi:hypothetical protein B0I35DRAFT_397075 [Stachybotrys elegans]|uniref:Zn(2)-C6 fungal-type domain-containing protein n=1 Tax=Stachybotrys elegans TaxID=80388 RepID=A0A8K0SNN8_9HYPO|nr:hypothetical protein B0I35DRAFT_397075 [Stachybotrys elegans]
MNSASPSSTASRVEPNLKRRRKPLSCEPCRHSKLRCDRQLPCATCLKRGWQDQCLYGETDAAGPSQRRRRTRNSAPVMRVTDTLISPPGQTSDNSSSQSPEPVPGRSPSPEPIQHRWDKILCRPPIEKNAPSSAAGVSFTLSFGPSIPLSELLDLLPSDSVCEYLVSRYFANVVPLFRILHGPTFQKQYLDFLQSPQQTDLSWLALLFAICSLTLKTVPPTDPGLVELWQDQSAPPNLEALSQKYRNAAMMSLAQDQFLVRHNLNTLEALLVLIHTITDCEGAEYGWALLGTAHNIAVALRCHVDSGEAPCIQTERRRRCWAGILILHTYQALLFRDTDLSFLCEMKAPMPADANDNDILPYTILSRPANANEPTHMSLMRFQIRLFHLSTDICNQISSPHRFDEDSLNRLDAAVAAEQQKWDSLYLVDGARNILDTAGYAHWCILQTYAHQLYLLLHRPFHNSRARFRQASRDRCIKSSLALMEIHRQLYELPRLKCYRWMVNGSITCNALHGAVALTSCLLDKHTESDFSQHIAAIDATVHRLEKLRGCSPACASVYPILRHLQSRLASRDPVQPAQINVERRFDDWINNIDWFRPDDIGWDFWSGDFSVPTNELQ